ncbi:MAG: hypothetical protein GTO41_19115 [Burkholderiales bacterium]|nr:hypothetical protein [Burkholderiales bacterium]
MLPVIASRFPVNSFFENGHEVDDILGLVGQMLGKGPIAKARSGADMVKAPVRLEDECTQVAT